MNESNEVLVNAPIKGKKRNQFLIVRLSESERKKAATMATEGHGGDMSALVRSLLREAWKERVSLLEPAERVA